MRARVVLCIAASAAAWPGPPPAAAPDVKTVCTITVNSADEGESFRRFLPPAKYRFVELVERNRSDWLASACRAAVACDMLVVSGHYDGSTEFFSDRLEVREYLPVAELERVACSDSCPSLFAKLEEVYLFGCNTLNPQPQAGASADLVRSLVREGHSPKEVARHLQELNAGYGESSRERMRQIFKDVPVIYGFSAAAPLGPVAAATLDRYFRARGDTEVGRGRPGSGLLSTFSTYGLSAASGMTERDPFFEVRQDICRFADDRVGDAGRLAFVHELLQRHMAEARLFLDRIQRYVASLDDDTRRRPDVARELDAIARDVDARQRFLAFARDADQPEVRVRMVDLARGLGWLSEDQRWDELALMLGQLLGRKVVGTTEVDLACTLNAQHDLEGAFNRRVVPGSAADDVAHAAVRACLGSSEGHVRTLAGLLGTNEADARIAQTYLRHRPITDAAELRRLALGIVRMAPSEAQERALEALGRHYIADPEVLELLTRLYAATPSAPVQVAIAGILMRADPRSIRSPQLGRLLHDERRRAPAGENMIDALIRRLQAR